MTDRRYGVFHASPGRAIAAHRLRHAAHASSRLRGLRGAPGRGRDWPVENSREDQVLFAKHFERAQGWLALDKFDEAAQALDRIPPAFQGRVEVLHLRAQLGLASVQWALSTALFRQLIEADDTEPQYWVSLAYATRRSQSIAQAEPILREAGQRFPRTGLIWYNLACYAAQEARLPEAHELLQEALRLEPGLLALAKADEDLRPYWAGRPPGKGGG